MYIKHAVLKFTVALGFTLAVLQQAAHAQTEPAWLSHKSRIEPSVMQPNAVIYACLSVSEDLILENDVECINIDPLGDYERDITVDLNGFTVNGSVTGYSGSITLENGTIANGRIELGGYVVIDNITLRDYKDYFAVIISSGKIMNSVFENNDVAIDLYWGGGIEISNSRFIDNLYAINLALDSQTVIENNYFEGNVNSIKIWDEEEGGASDNIVRRNYFRNNDYAVILQATQAAIANVITENVIVGNGSSGIAIILGCSAQYCGGELTEVSKNKLFDNGYNPIALTRPYEDPVIFNDGITVDTYSDTADDWPIAAAGITITGNITGFNADLGIDALYVTDGGGNKAMGNLNAEQCVGVDCAALRGALKKCPNNKKSSNFKKSRHH